MKKGFTLIELIVVIAIIAVLAAIIAPNAFRAIEKGKISATIGDLKSLKTASMSFYADTGTWPVDTDEESEPNTFIEDDSDDPIDGWDGPYLEKFPMKTPFGGDYEWENDGDFDGDGTSTEQYLHVTSISGDVSAKIDRQLDGGDGEDEGNIRYDEDAETLDYLVADY